MSIVKAESARERAMEIKYKQTSERSESNTEKTASQMSAKALGGSDRVENSISTRLHRKDNIFFLAILLFFSIQGPDASDIYDIGLGNVFRILFMGLIR